MKAIHIDGRPTAWFEYKRNGETEFASYVAFAWLGDDPAKLVRHANEVVAKIEKMSCMNGKGEAPVIFWRRRMECIYEEPIDKESVQAKEFFAEPHDGRWHISFRLAAIPQLTNEQWASLDPRPEGACATVPV